MNKCTHTHSHTSTHTVSTSNYQTYSMHAKKDIHLRPPKISFPLLSSSLFWPQRTNVWHAHTHTCHIMTLTVGYSTKTPALQSHLWFLSQCGTRWGVQGPKVQYRDTCPWSAHKEKWKLSPIHNLNTFFCSVFFFSSILKFMVTHYSILRASRHFDSALWLNRSHSLSRAIFPLTQCYINAELVVYFPASLNFTLLLWYS